MSNDDGLAKLLSNEEEFIKKLNEYDSDLKGFMSVFLNSTQNPTLLQMICRKGLTKVFEALKEKYNLSNNSTGKQEVELCLWNEAINEGNVEIFKSLLKNSVFVDYHRYLTQLFETIYVNNNKRRKIKENRTEINHEKCFVLLLEKQFEETRISDCDNKDYFNKILCHAAKLGCDVIVTKLLELGASLAYPFVVVENLDGDILENHLNQCISRIRKDEKGSLISLAPNDSPASDLVEFNLDSLMSQPQDCVPETEFILRLAKVEKLRHLLLHPVVQAFLLKKWQTICFIFYCNVALYWFFVWAFTAKFIIMYTIDDKLCDKYLWFRLCDNVVIVCLNISLALLFMREMFQLIISPKNYFTNWENYFELSTFFLVFVSQVLVGADVDDVMKITCSITMPMVTFQLTLLLSKHPKLSFMIAFQKAAFHFIKLLLVYSPLIMGFFLSFYMLLSEAGRSEGKCEENFINNVVNLLVKNSETSGNDDATEFSHLGTSLFKSLIMLAGEYDSSSINFETYPFTSRLIFIAFVFLCSIVLISLLNGFAVSDVQTIMNDTDLIYYKHLTHYIHDVEIVMSSISNKLDNFIRPSTTPSNCCGKFLQSSQCFKTCFTNVSATFKNTLIFYDKKANNKRRLVAFLCTNQKEQQSNRGCYNFLKSIKSLFTKTSTATSNSMPYLETTTNTDNDESEFEFNDDEKDSSSEKPRRLGSSYISITNLETISKTKNQSKSDESNDESRGNLINILIKSTPIIPEIEDDSIVELSSEIQKKILAIFQNERRIMETKETVTVLETLSDRLAQMEKKSDKVLASAQMETNLDKVLALAQIEKKLDKVLANLSSDRDPLLRSSSAPI